MYEKVLKKSTGYPSFPPFAPFAPLLHWTHRPSVRPSVPFVRSQITTHGFEKKEKKKKKDGYSQ